MQQIMSMVNKQTEQEQEQGKIRLDKKQTRLVCTAIAGNGKAIRAAKTSVEAIVSADRLKAGLNNVVTQKSNALVLKDMVLQEKKREKAAKAAAAQDAAIM